MQDTDEPGYVNFMEQMMQTVAEQKIERHDDWETPESVFTPLHKIFHFELDAAATFENRKCTYWMGPGSNCPDALAEDAHWHRFTSVWLNPPYKDLTPWVQKANDEALKGCTVVMLIPNSRDTKWYHDIIVPAKRAGYCRTYSRCGRIAFVDPHPGAKRQAPKQGNMLVVFTPPMPEEWAED